MNKRWTILMVILAACAALLASSVVASEDAAEKETVVARASYGEGKCDVTGGSKDFCVEFERLSVQEGRATCADMAEMCADWCSWGTGYSCCFVGQDGGAYGDCHCMAAY